MTSSRYTTFRVHGAECRVMGTVLVMVLVLVLVLVLVMVMVMILVVEGVRFRIQAIAHSQARQGYHCSGISPNRTVDLHQDANGNFSTIPSIVLEKMNYVMDLIRDLVVDVEHGEVVALGDRKLLARRIRLLHPVLKTDMLSANMAHIRQSIWHI